MGVSVYTFENKQKITYVIEVLDTVPRSHIQDYVLVHGSTSSKYT